MTEAPLDTVTRLLEWTTRALASAGLGVRVTIIETVPPAPGRAPVAAGVEDDAAQDYARKMGGATGRRCACGQPTRGPRYATCLTCVERRRRAEATTP